MLLKLSDLEKKKSCPNRTLRPMPQLSIVNTPPPPQDSQFMRFMGGFTVDISGCVRNQVYAAPLSPCETQDCH